MRDFSRKTVSALAAKGIKLVGLTVIPGVGDLPFATGDRGYRVDDNGCGRVWNFTQVMEAANA
jgi:spore germination protein YaaH